MNSNASTSEDEVESVPLTPQPLVTHHAPLDEDEREEPEEEDEDEEEPEEEAGPSLAELHEELIASTAESRRGNRRVLDVLKNFGSVLDALSTTVNDTHRTLRAIPQQTDSAPPSVREQALPLVDLADRLARVAEGFSRPPETPLPWWPGARKAVQTWQDAWTMQSNALQILQSHTLTLLNQASLSRLSVVGKPFDPQTMTAVESTIDPSKPDHTVIAELLPGWIHTPSGQLIRPAQVRVSRTSAR